MNCLHLDESSQGVRSCGGVSISPRRLATGGTTYYGDKMKDEYKVLAIAGLLIVVLIGAVYSQVYVAPQVVEEDTFGWYLEDENSIFNKKTYKSGADVTVGNNILNPDYVSPWTFDPTKPPVDEKGIVNDTFYPEEARVYPSRYWYNIWYKAERSTEWVLLYGVEDETTINATVEEKLKQPHLGSYEIEEVSTKILLEPLTIETDEDLEGELRVDLRVQLIHIGIFLYDEATLGTDYATIGPEEEETKHEEWTSPEEPEEEEIIPEEYERRIPGFEALISFVALGVVFILLRRRR